MKKSFITSEPGLYLFCDVFHYCRHTVRSIEHFNIMDESEGSLVVFNSSCSNVLLPYLAYLISASPVKIQKNIIY